MMDDDRASRIPEDVASDRWKLALHSRVAELDCMALLFLITGGELVVRYLS
jgi:hypothetical protein